MVRKLTTLSIVTLAASAVLMGQAGDANKVLADMKAAIGGADRIAAVKTLTAVGTTQKVMGKSLVESETEIAMALPDKYVARTMLVPRPLGPDPSHLYRRSGFNGRAAINETENLANLDGRIITVRTPGMVWPDGPQTPEQKADLDRHVVLAAKRDFARMILGMLGSSSVLFPLELSYAGQEDLPEGKAHVITARGSDEFEARLFVDSKTGIPMMMTWTALTPFVAWSITREDSLAEPAVQRQIQATTAQWEKNEAARRMVEYRVWYSNFKIVDGLNLPHTLTGTIDGKPSDTTTFGEIKLNPTIDDSKFAVSKTPGS